MSFYIQQPQIGESVAPFPEDVDGAWLRTLCVGELVCRSTVAAGVRVCAPIQSRLHTNHSLFCNRNIIYCSTPIYVAIRSSDLWFLLLLVKQEKENLFDIILAELHIISFHLIALVDVTEVVPQLRRWMPKSFSQVTILSAGSPKRDVDLWSEGC